MGSGGGVGGVLGGGVGGGFRLFCFLLVVGG